MSSSRKNKNFKKPQQQTQPKEKWHSKLEDETKYSILSIFFFVFSIFLSLAAFDKAGVIGNYTHKTLFFLFGAGFFLTPLVFFLIAISFLISFKPGIFKTTIIGGTLFLLSSLGAVDILFGEKTAGYVGFFVSFPLIKLFDFWVSLILMLSLLIISILIILNVSIKLNLRKKKDEEILIKDNIVEQQDDTKDSALTKVKELIEEVKEMAKKETKPKEKDKNEDEEEKEIILKGKKLKHISGFQSPPIDFLETSKGKPSSGDIKANSNIIKRTLQNFGIDVEMNEVNVGPSVTQYTLKPAEGIKLSKILALQNDLSLALAAHPLRIEAPIPGKSVVGIEIPNTTKTLVGLADLISSNEFQSSPHPLLLSLGKDTAGNNNFANLAKMPHLLIAGATGTGKSVTIHTLITSLLYKNSPEMLKFIMIDPKRVELTIYNNIPHLLTPVITNAKKAISALKWGTKEMDRRYEILLKHGVRDISSYHKNILPDIVEEKEHELMPNIVIIIDELADLMATYPREVESSIVRLAQMSRAVGIHLIVSTQRPSVEVITGLIKANITSRIALQVASQIDSRTILDMSGAEKLLGNGDMLYLAGDVGKPKRIQCPFISDKEIKKVVNYLAEKYENNESEIDDLNVDEPKGSLSQNEFSFTEDDMDDNDDFYEEAREMVIKTGKASSSYLQRRFKIGYARAARIMDMLEERGVVGPGEGAKPREVLIKDAEESIQENDDV